MLINCPECGKKVQIKLLLKETFAAKTNLLLMHFIDMAVQGYGWVAA